MSATITAGEALRRLRVSRRLTQREVGALGGFSGTTISLMETGEKGGGRPSTWLGVARSLGFPDVAAMIAEASRLQPPDPAARGAAEIADRIEVALAAIEAKLDRLIEVWS